MPNLCGLVAGSYQALKRTTLELRNANVEKQKSTMGRPESSTRIDLGTILGVADQSQESRAPLWPLEGCLPCRDGLDRSSLLLQWDRRDEKLLWVAPH